LGSRYLSPLSRVGDALGGPFRLAIRNLVSAIASLIWEGVNSSMQSLDKGLTEYSRRLV